MTCNPFRPLMTLVGIIVASGTAIAQAPWPGYDAPTAGAFNVDIEDTHWALLTDVYPDGGQLTISPVWEDEFGCNSFGRAEARDIFITGNGYINHVDHVGDRTIAPAAVASRTRSYEHREAGLPTPGTVTLISATVRVDVRLNLTDPACRGALEGATQYECNQLGVLLTADRNFARSTNATQIGQASFPIGPVTVNLAFVGNQGAGEYTDGDTDSDGGDTARVTCVGITHRTRCRLELWAGCGSWPLDLTGASCAADVRGYVNSTTRLSH